MVRNLFLFFYFFHGANYNNMALVIWMYEYLDALVGSGFLVLVTEGARGAVRVEVVEGIRIAREDCVVAYDEVVANQCGVWCFHCV
jgi:hypothetical protein